VRQPFFGETRLLGVSGAGRNSAAISRAWSGPIPDRGQETLWPCATGPSSAQVLCAPRTVLNSLWTNIPDSATGLPRCVPGFAPRREGAQVDEAERAVSGARQLWRAWWLPLWWCRDSASYSSLRERWDPGQAI
jgi:hypothetical protein